jgi:N-acetyl-anhydromuramyl-L-alanine amidase AmpD
MFRNVTSQTPISFQGEAVAALSQVLVTKYEISPKNIVSHADFAPSRKSDVSGYFDYKSFYETLGIYSGLYTSDLTVSDQVKMLLQPSTAYNSKVKSIQQQLYK